MALNIISNFAANVAQRNLVMSDRAVTNSLAKLSSGSRVNSAKDDAASLAIGSRLNAEVQAQKQAQVNAIQATSMLQIADGAMAKVNDILVRMKTLGVQSGSGQLSSTERTLLDTEYQQLLSEIDRIAADTEFNGVKLVDGSTQTAASQNGQTDSLNVIQAGDGFTSITFDSSVGDIAFAVEFDATADNLVVTRLSDGVSETISLGSTAIAINESQTASFGTLGVTIVLNSGFDKTTDIQPTGTFSGNADTDFSGIIQDSSISITRATNGTSAGEQLEDLATNIISIGAADASTATFTIGNYTGTADLDATGLKTVTLSNASGADFTIVFNLTELVVDSASGAHTFDVDDLGTHMFGTTNTAATTTSFTFKLGTGSIVDVDDVTFSINAVNVSALSLSSTDVLSAGTANTASSRVTTAIDTLNTARASIGAGQNRLEFASDNLASTIENSEAARSNLMDLDVAVEMTTFTSKLILVQAGVAMLSQANQLPQNLLQLFR